MKLLALVLALAGAAAAGSSPTVSRTTPHLAVVAKLSQDTIAPGDTITIQADVTPKRGMHVYAPGSMYRVVAVAIQPDALIRVHDPVYPPATPYVFKPLNETVLVYSAPFRILLDVTAGETASAAATLRARSRLTIKGSLNYQACDDSVCYLPQSVPLEWTAGIKR